MTTKEQEIKALEKIRKIVNDLGEDSYIAIAFEGCFKDAEENIDNDFGVSMYSRWQGAEKKIGEYKKLRDELIKEHNLLKFEFRNLKDEYETEAKKLEHWYTVEKENTQENIKYVAEIEKYTRSTEELTKQVKAQEETIMKLKAKLYDLMVKEGN